MFYAQTLDTVANSFNNTVNAMKLLLYRRATAIISQTLEALPVLSLPIGFGLASKPDLLQIAIASSPFVLVANLIDGSL